MKLDINVFGYISNGIRIINVFKNISKRIETLSI